MASKFSDEEDAAMWPEGASKTRPAQRKPVLATPLRTPPAKVDPSQPEQAVEPLNWPELDGKVPPERKWALKGWIGMGHTTLMVGAGGIGKTLLAQEIGSALALGMAEFIGAIEREHRVLMWACEDDHDELWRRQVNIAQYFKRPISDFGNFILVPRHGQENALAVRNYENISYTPLLAQLSEQANDCRADVVILDNVAQLYGAGENDRHAVTAFLNNLSGALGNRAILLLAHPSRMSGSEFSGSSAWENVARTRLYLGSHLPDQATDPDREVNQDERYLCRRKANYSNKDWRRFTYEFGVLVPENIENSTDGGIVASIREKNAERLVLDAIHKLQAMGIYGNEAQRSPQFLPKLIMDFNLGNGQTKPDITSAMRRLMSEGRIVKTSVGKNANRSDRIGFIIPDKP